MLELERVADGRFRSSFEDTWCQGRTAYGGLSAAFGVAALETVVPAERDLLGIDVAFVGPLAPGAVDIEARVLRSGKNLTHATAVVRDAAGAVATTVHGVLGSPRSSKIRRDVPPPAPAAAADAVAPIPFLPGMTPAFTQHFEMRLVAGAPPFSGADDTRVQGFARHRTRASGVCAIVGLLDAWWSPALAMGKGPFFASSVRWAANFATGLRASAAALGDAPVYYESELVAAADGYATFVANMYAGERHIAWSEQLVALFD